MNDDPTTEAVPSGTLDDTPEATFVLRVLEGPERGAAYAIGGAHPPRVVVGSGPLADVRFTGRRVSRRHVAFALEGGALVVTDLGSKNGTWVGPSTSPHPGPPVASPLRIREVELRGGEQVIIGDATVLVERGAPAHAPLAATDRFGSVLGKSRTMRRLFPMLEKLAKTTVPVVIQGEAGTGKELLAEALHAAGPRQDGPFVVVDSAMIPGSHLELELFGHAAGIAGAEARAGAFEAASGGTLFLKDVSEIDLPLQARLLRALERSEVRRVGADARIPADVRLVVATRRDLDREVQLGRFRDDLFQRLAVVRVELPPLRKRAEDIPLLAAHFATLAGATLAALEPGVLDGWRENAWPGNVRELQREVARHIALGELAPLSYAPAHEDVVRDDWLEKILDEKLPLTEAREKVLRAFEARYLARMLAETGGNVVRAAARSGIARRYFQILKARYGVG